MKESNLQAWWFKCPFFLIQKYINKIQIKYKIKMKKIFFKCVHYTYVIIL